MRAAAGDGTSNRQTLSMTTDPDKFGAELQGGDLLLFDSLHLLSQFLKLADDRPVNHCAVYLGGGLVAQCNEPLPNRPDQAIYRTPLSELLGLTRVRTVTAFRHQQVVDGASPTPVVTRAQRFVDASGPYAYVDLAKLAAPCLLRAYRGELARDHMSAVIALLRSVASLIDAYDRARNSLGIRRRPNKVGMTCSSFAYRCYVDGTRDPGDDSFPVHLNAPLATLAAPVMMRTPPRRVGALPRVGTATSGIPGLTFHPALDPVTTGDGAAARVEGADDLAARRAWARRTVIELARASRPVGQMVPAGPVDAAVTPRDLWGSGSFHPVALFHRPPGGPADDGAIDVPV